jgi:hypothetical protein
MILPDLIAELNAQDPLYKQLGVQKNLIFWLCLITEINETPKKLSDKDRQVYEQIKSLINYDKMLKEIK